MRYSANTAIITFTLLVGMLWPASRVFADWATTIAASNPLNWYRLDELAGSTATDHGSEGLHGTYGTGTKAPTRGVAGLVGTGVDFDGNEDTIYLSGSDLAGDWTAEFIVRKNVAAGRSSILIRGIPFAFPSTALKFEQHEAPEQVGYTQFGQVDYVFTPEVLAPLGEFLHLVYVKDAIAVRAYVNGALAGTRFDPISLSRYQLGDEFVESPFATLDEVVIYDRALMLPEISDHYEAVPEPSSYVLALIGMGAVVAFCRRR